MREYISGKGSFVEGSPMQPFLSPCDSKLRHTRPTTAGPAKQHFQRAITERTRYLDSLRKKPVVHLPGCGYACVLLDEEGV